MHSAVCFTCYGRTCLGGQRMCFVQDSSSSGNSEERSTSHSYAHLETQNRKYFTAQERSVPSVQRFFCCIVDWLWLEAH